MRNLANKIQTLTLIFLGMAISACSSTGDKPLSVNKSDMSQITRATLLDKEGDSEVIELDDMDSLRDELYADLRSQGIQVNNKKFLCDDYLETEWRMLTKVEVKMELSNIIDNLQHQSKPRRLSDVELLTMKKAQLCSPFLMDLNLISKLIKGYDIQEVDYQ